MRKKDMKKAVYVFNRLEAHLETLIKRGYGSYSAEIAGYILAIIEQYKKDYDSNDTK